MTKIKKIAFIGLGTIGRPVAAHIARAGFELTVFNRTDTRAIKLVDELKLEGISINLANNPAAAAENKDVVICCVGNDQDVEQIVLGSNGAMEGLQPGSILIDHTTTSANLARKLWSVSEQKGFNFIDAPVSGGQIGAEQGRLAIMCGGTERTFRKVASVLDCYASSVIHVGEAGAGQTAKMANQMCIAGIIGGLSEAVRLVQAAGLDTEKTFRAISSGAAQSWQMDNRWETMVANEFDFGFAIDWMRKDLRYALDEAAILGLSSPISSLVDQFYAEVQANGGGRLDTSALIKRLPTGEK